jgi:hypothetical protein
MADKKKKIEIGELLERLTVIGDVGTDSALFRGVAVSHSETALHLSTNSGIVEIPLAEIEDVSEIGGHPNAVVVTVRDSSTVRVIRIETGDDGGASMVATARLRAGDDGGTIPSGPYPTGTRSTRSIHDNIGNDFQEEVIDDWNNALVL